MKIILFKHKLANWLIRLAYRLDPVSDAYKKYVMEKAIEHAVMGGMIKIEWCPTPDKEKK